VGLNRSAIFASMADGEAPPVAAPAADSAPVTILISSLLDTYLLPPLQETDAVFPGPQPESIASVMLWGGLNAHIHTLRTQYASIMTWV